MQKFSAPLRGVKNIRDVYYIKGRTCEKRLRGRGDAALARRAARPAGRPRAPVARALRVWRMVRVLCIDENLVKSDGEVFIKVVR